MPQPTPTRPDRVVFPLFNSLRAIAALSICFYHLTAFTDVGPAVLRWGGRLEVGVTVFFLISGFLLYRPFVAARLHGHRRPGTATYAWRRFLRIVPAYWVALTIIAVWLGKDYVFGADAPIYYGFAQIYSFPRLLNGIPQAWTLGVEVTFYAFLPLYALAMRAWPATSRRQKLHGEVVGLVVIAVISLWYRGEFVLSSGGPFSLQLNGALNALPRYLDQFALGMALAVASVWLEGRPRRPAPIRLIERYPSVAWLLSLVALWLVSTQIGLTGHPEQAMTPTQFTEHHYLSGAVAFGLVLPAVFGDPRIGVVRRILVNRWLLWVGLVSYGFYLWHHAVLEQLQAWSLPGEIANAVGISHFIVWVVMGIAGTLAIAAASYYFVEKPALRLKRVNPRDVLRGVEARQRLVVAIVATAAAGLTAAALIGTTHATIDLLLAVTAAASIAFTVPASRRWVEARLPVRLPQVLLTLGLVSVVLTLLTLVAGGSSRASPVNVSQPGGLPYRAHVVETYDGRWLTLYVNGKPAAAAKLHARGTKARAPLDIGTLGGQRPWDGRMDEVAVYQTAVPAATLRQHYLAGIGGVGSGGYAQLVRATPGLLGYWRLDDVAGPYAANQTGGPSGRFRPGVRRGAPGLISNDSNRAIQLDGMRGSVEVPGVFVGGHSLTVEAWVSANAVSNRYLLGSVGGYFLKTDLFGRFEAGLFADGRARAIVGRSRAQRSPPPAARVGERASTSEGTGVLVLGLVAALELVGGAVLLIRRRRLAGSLAI